MLAKGILVTAVTWAMAAAAPGGGAEAASFPRSRPGELPDSVVARVAGRRDVTVSEFRRAWHARPDAAPARITPAAAAGFLELLVDRELLAEAAARERWEWTAAESAQSDALADRLAVSAALDSVLADARQGLPAGTGAGPTAEEIGIAARDSTLARIGCDIDRPALERLAPAWRDLPRPAADSSLAAQLRMIAVLPQVAPADTALVVARSPAGQVRAADLLDAWRRLPPAYRPRIEGPDQLEDLVRNALFERVLRREVARGGFRFRPEIAVEVGALWESFAVERLVRRDAVPAGPVTDAVLERWYRDHEARFRRPLRLRAIRLAHDTRDEAGRTAVRLRDGPAAESLAAAARRAGIGYEVELTAADSALFAAGLAAGPGAVVGPVAAADGWVVARIVAVLPEAARPFAEARGEIERRWRAEETERRLRDLCGRLARRIAVRVNDAALRRLASE
jgi:hypothetical protein